jgi:hypothetical protein
MKEEDKDLIQGSEGTFVNRETNTNIYNVGIVAVSPSTMRTNEGPQ